MAEALDRYAYEALPTKKSARPVTYHIRKVREDLGPISLAAITSSVLAKYRDQQMTKGYAAQPVKHNLSLISRVLNICIKEWGIALPAGNPVLHVKMPRAANARDRRLIANELPRPLTAARSYGRE